MAGLVIIPLMVFAAFGVDLAAWYARVSEIQRAADAAALAGAVWMPNLGTATTEANASMRSNGFVNGQDSITTSVTRGATPTSVRVTITDGDVDRYFSNVFQTGPVDLTRFAEAEYNLPLPLGSPLNYFGGDATRTAPAQSFSYTVNWPTDYSTRRPANSGCNVSQTYPGANLGRWSSATPPTYVSGANSGSTACVWTVAGTAAGTSTSNVPPPDYFSRVPTNGTSSSGCIVRTNGTGAVLGRWQSSVYANGTFSSPTTVCTFQVFNTVASSIPSFATSRVPVNGGTGSRCRVSYSTTNGWWDGGTYRTTSVPTGGAAGSPPGSGSGGTGNQLCRWGADVTQTDTTPPNPIDSSRSPGFWAAVEGPQTNAYQGDAYSTRCYGGGPSCSSVQNAQYLTGPNRGYWYVIKIPSGLTGSVAINIFDGSYVRGSTGVRAGDRGLDGSTTTFPTQFQVYRQNNPLDYTARTALFSGSPDTADGSCNWELRDESAFSGVWRNLCTLTGVAPGDLYLLNVQSIGTAGAGVNGYAIEAVANGSHAGIQPSLYAFGSMQMQNNNFCGTGTGDPPCPPPPATFYLAEVAPQYAGKVVVMELWDPGDVSGSATMTPMMPSASSPRPVVPVSALDCTFTADTAPNGRLGVSGTEYLTPQPSDDATECQIDTAISGARFNGEWLRIRINVPDNYTCTQGLNPETTAGSCWWGIRYSFSASANDVTTWQARVEGNPLQLTQ